MGTVELWNLQICKPNGADQCQARNVKATKRCARRSSKLMRHNGTGIVVEVCGHHFNAMLKDGWRNYG
jgi:hypothetical protein